MKRSSLTTYRLGCEHSFLNLVINARGRSGCLCADVWAKNPKVIKKPSPDHNYFLGHCSMSITSSLFRWMHGPHQMFTKCLQRSFWHRQYIICDIVSLHCWLTKAYTSANTKCPFFTNPSLPLTMLPSERTIDKAPFSSFFCPHISSTWILLLLALVP